MEFKGNLKAPLLGTRKISDFTAIKRTLGKDSSILRKKLSEGEVTTGKLLHNTIFFLEIQD